MSHIRIILSYIFAVGEAVALWLARYLGLCIERFGFESRPGRFVVFSGKIL